MLFIIRAHYIVGSIYNNFKQCFITAYKPPTYNVQYIQELFDYMCNLRDVNFVVTISEDFNVPNIN